MGQPSAPSARRAEPPTGHSSSLYSREPSLALRQAGPSQSSAGLATPTLLPLASRINRRIPPVSSKSQLYDERFFDDGPVKSWQRARGIGDSTQSEVLSYASSPYLAGFDVGPSSLGPPQFTTPVKAPPLRTSSRQSSSPSSVANAPRRSSSSPRTVTPPQRPRRSSRRTAPSTSRSLAAPTLESSPPRSASGPSHDNVPSNVPERRDEQSHKAPGADDSDHQRRMASLISGLGLTFASAPDESMDEKNPDPRWTDAVRQCSVPAETYEPGSPNSSGLSSGSDVFESAEEGDDDFGAIRRRLSFTRTALSASERDGSFDSSSLSTIIDNSPLLSKEHHFEELLNGASPPRPVMFFDYDADIQPISFATLATEVLKPPTTTHLFRRAIQQPRVVDDHFLVEQEKRLSIRASDRLDLDDLDLQISHSLESDRERISSYTPSPDLLQWATPNTASYNPSPPHTSRSESTSPLPSDPTFREQKYQANSYVGSPASPSSTHDTPKPSIRSSRPASRRRSLSAASALLPRPELVAKHVDGFLAAPVAQSSLASQEKPTLPSSPRQTSPLPHATSRSRTNSESASPFLSLSKSSRRLSTLFGIGKGRDDDKDATASLQSVHELSRPPRTRAATDGLSSLVKSPQLASSTSIGPSPSLIGGSPFSNQTWKSTMSPSEYDALSTRYGRLEMRRQEVIWELGETEKSFVAGLSGVIRVFMQPLQNSVGTWIGGVPVAVARLLDWLQDIVYLHSQISNALQSARPDHFPVVSTIANVFLPFVARLDVYQPYLVRFESVTKEIEEMTADSASDFGEFVRVQSSLPECAAMSLSSFLLKPVQRLMKLPLFFRQLCELTPVTHPDHLATLSLLHSTDSIIRVMQDVKTREDEYLETKALAKRIRGLPDGFQLARRDRRLIAQGPLRRVHVSDKDRSRLEIDAVSRAAGSTTPSMTSPVPSRSFLGPEAARRLSLVSQTSSNNSVASMTHSESSAASTTLPSTPAGSYDAPSLQDFILEELSPRFDGGQLSPKISSKSERIVKTRAKESALHVFVFSDLVVLATRTSDSQRFMRSPKPNTRRLEASSFKVLESIGLSRVLGVSDLSGKTEHDHLIEVDLLSMPKGEKAMPTLSQSTTSLATSIYLTVPPPSSSSTPSSSRAEASALKERQRWVQAFEKSYLFALRSLSFPSMLNEYTAPVTANERLSISPRLGSVPFETRMVARSPSQQQLHLSLAVTTDGDDCAKAERAERAFWAARLKVVRKELEGSLGGGTGMGERWDRRSSGAGKVASPILPSSKRGLGIGGI